MFKSFKFVTCLFWQRNFRLFLLKPKRSIKIGPLKSFSISSRFYPRTENKGMFCPWILNKLLARSFRTWFVRQSHYTSLILRSFVLQCNTARIFNIFLLLTNVKYVCHKNLNNKDIGTSSWIGNIPSRYLKDTFKVSKVLISYAHVSSSSKQK